MSGETVTYSLETILTRIEGKIDNLQRDVNQKFDKIDERFDRIDERLNKVEIGLATLTEKVVGMDKRLEKVENEQVKSIGLVALTEKVGGMDKRLEKVESEQATMIKAISDLQGFRGLILPIIVGALSATIGAVITVTAKMLLIGNSP
ncbi:hypothetical protein [Microcystis aeruginosa]|uniref:Shikimate dehydrogenase n=1 Tax=Microcystis aeruginosa Ma_QC_C_20070703_M131 TaxID=2486263 RepID=A0A551XYN7_MICAE|nr:hypothetical protein [Microcystis aeruginosa]MDB9390684.1 hypothetical protein [Microcystis aeruginosa CS-579]TRT53833.1 MAG: hypothetical protein EWV85_13135 [Microcystis aeruginosa Ma_QC_C_20070703_M131]